MSPFLIRFISSQPNQKPSEKGFTTIEVLVAILVSLSFLLVAVQTIATAAAIRVRAQESSDAATWVQVDRTVIENQALTLGGYDPVNRVYTDIDTDRCAANNANEGFAAQLRDNPDTGAVIGVEETLPQVSPIGQRDYTLERKTSIDDSDPHILKVDYQVFRGTDTSGEAIFSYRAEFIPGVTFTCRQI